MSQSLTVCVIGAGGDQIGKDKYGNDIHTSMYKDLMTNTPKEIMGYPNLPFLQQEDSYVTPEDVLKYYHWYAKKFDLFKYIQFEHNVILVRPLANKTWEVIVMDLASNACKKLHFDAVMVCNGHNSMPDIPKFKGQQIFRGKQLHSHDFRNANDFKGERVCIIGAGPSANEMVTLISKVAEHVTCSNHSKRPSTPHTFHTIEEKPDIASISVGSVTFVDGTTQNFSVIIYATGYLYTFPFLSIDCGLSIVHNRVQPLYKYCI